jgi:hypothetical protein
MVEIGAYELRRGSLRGDLDRALQQFAAFPAKAVGVSRSLSDGHHLAGFFVRPEEVCYFFAIQRYRCAVIVRRPAGDLHQTRPSAALDFLIGKSNRKPEVEGNTARAKAAGEALRKKGARHSRRAPSLGRLPP